MSLKTLIFQWLNLTWLFKKSVSVKKLVEQRIQIGLKEK